MNKIDKKLLDILVCPVSKESLEQIKKWEQGKRVLIFFGGKNENNQRVGNR